MLRHMKTTVRLEEALLKRAKREAAKQGKTFTALVEEGLRLVLAKPANHIGRRTVRLPVCSVGGGTLPGVDIGNSADLIDRMEGIH